MGQSRDGKQEMSVLIKAVLGTNPHSCHATSAGQVPT